MTDVSGDPVADAGSDHTLILPGNQVTLNGSDGGTWAKIGNSVRVPVSRSAEAGLAVTSHNDGVLTTAAIDSVTLTPASFPRLLFIRGGPGTGGFLEGGGDEQLADLGDFSTAGGNHGWGEFAEILMGAGYSLDAMIEGSVANNTPVDLTTIELSDYAAVIFGSNNADYTGPQIDALESYVRGGALFISDANFGSHWSDAPDSDQLFLDRFGLVINQDQGVYTLDRTGGDFTAPAHPVLTGVDEFDGEGVSPLVLGVLPTPTGATITKLAAVKNSTRNNDVSGDRGSSRPVTVSDASLVAIELDYGRVIGHFDRNTFFNLNGAGTSIQRFENTQLAINLMGWLSGAIDPLSPYAGWAQSHFAGLPGGRENALAAAWADPDGDLLDNDAEFALGTDPNNPGDGNGGVTLTTAEEAGRIHITLGFLRRNDDPDLTVESELSVDLAGWASGTAVFETLSAVDQGNGYEMVVVKTCQGWRRKAGCASGFWQTVELRVHAFVIVGSIEDPDPRASQELQGDQVRENARFFVEIEPQMNSDKHE